MEAEIKMITETLQHLSGQALWAFVIYIVLGKLLSHIIAGAIGITILVILKRTLLVGLDTGMRSVNITKRIRDGLDIGCGGCLMTGEIEKVERAMPDIITAYTAAHPES